MINSFSTYFFPQPPQKWEIEDVRQANELNKPFYDLANGCVVFGVLAGIVTTCGTIIRKIRGEVITSKFIYLGISCVALVTLGMAFYLFGRRHYQGLTEKRKTELALQEFKQGLSDLPVCQSQDELNDKLANDATFTSQVAHNVIKSADEISLSFAQVYYRPTKDLQPRFEIHQGLVMNQQQDLLNLAYEKGIILHFKSYEQRIFSFEGPQPVFPNKEYSAEILQKMELSFECSVMFLVNHLQPLDLQRIDFINEQLRALSFKWVDRVSEKEKVFYPRVYLEDHETVVIRGNFSDSNNQNTVIWAIESLVSHVNKIKVEGRGLLFALGVDEMGNFKDSLNARFSGKVILVDRLSDLPLPLPSDMDGIWQKHLPHRPALMEVLQDVIDDDQRNQ